MAKKLTLIILCVAFVVGTVGAWFSAFDIDAYGNFLKAFAPIYMALIASIGANSAIEKYTSKEEKA